MNKKKIETSIHIFIKTNLLLTDKKEKIQPVNMKKKTIINIWNIL